MPPRLRERVASFTHDCDVVLGQYLRGQLLVMLMMAAFYSVGLALFGFELAVPVGVFTGLAIFVPYVGFGIGMLLALLAGALQFTGWYGPIAVFVVYGIGQIVEGLFLTPKMVGQRIGMSTLTVIFALFAFGHLFGFVGVLIALPASALSRWPPRGCERATRRAVSTTDEADSARDRAGAGADLREFPARRERRGARPPARARARRAAGLPLGTRRQRQDAPAARARRAGRRARPAARLVLGGDARAVDDAGERDWLVIDDAHALDAAQQQAAFALFVDATTRGAGVVAAGSVPPVDLDVREDLRTRLGWGHVFALAPLARPRCAPRFAAKPTGAAPSSPTRSWTTC